VRSTSQQPTPPWLVTGAALALLLAACGPGAPAPTPTRPPETPAPAAGATTPTRPAATPAGAAAPAPGAPTAVTATTAVATATRPAATATSPPATAPPGAAPSKPSNRAEVTFRFATRLSTPEEIDEIGNILKERSGILDVIGDERSITIGYDPARLAPDQIRELLGNARHPVEP
jgi:hypothetical protein